MPRPHEGESEQEFVSRYMSDPEARRKYPDQKQRSAVAYSIYREWKKENKSYDLFFVKAPISKFWEEDVEVINKSTGKIEKSKQRFVEVIVSGLKEDRQGEMMSQEAIDDMILQFKSGTIPFFPDHGYSDNGVRYSWKQMMGVWVDGRQDGEHLKAVVRLNKAHPDSEIFWNYMQEGMPIGFSIGGKPKDEPVEMWVEDSEEPEMEKTKVTEEKTK